MKLEMFLKEIYLNLKHLLFQFWKGVRFCSKVTCDGVTTGAGEDDVIFENPV